MNYFEMHDSYTLMTPTWSSVTNKVVVLLLFCVHSLRETFLCHSAVTELAALNSCS